MSNPEEGSGTSVAQSDKLRSIPVTYEDNVDPVEDWTQNNDSNRRVLIREHSWMIKGAANRILRDLQYAIDDKGKVTIPEDVFRSTGPEDVRLNLKTTTRPDDKKFREEVLAEVQRVINQGPQNPEYERKRLGNMGVDDAVVKIHVSSEAQNVVDRGPQNPEYADGERRRQYNMDVDGAIIRALKLLPPHIKDPKMIKLPSDFFRAEDDKLFRSRVRSGVFDALNKAKEDHPTKLENAMFTINEQILTHPKINELRQELGKDVFDLTELFQWTVDLCHGEIPTRVTEEYMFYIFEEAVKIAEQMHAEITDPEKAVAVADGFKEAMLVAPEDLDAYDDFPGKVGNMHLNRLRMKEEIATGEENLRQFIKNREDAGDTLTEDEKETIKEMEILIRDAKKLFAQTRDELIDAGAYQLKDPVTGDYSPELAKLSGPEFAKALYKKMGIHFGFEGLQNNRELEPVAASHKDLARIFKFQMGWVDSGWFRKAGIPDPDRKRSLADSNREKWAKDHFNPSLLVAFDEGFFQNCPLKEKIARTRILKQMLGFGHLGVVKAMEMKGRVATLEGKGEEGKERANALLNKENLVALGPNLDNAEWTQYRQNRLDDSSNKSYIDYGLLNRQDVDSKLGITLGRVVPLNTRSEKPLGMDK